MKKFHIFFILILILFTVSNFSKFGASLVPKTGGIVNMENIFSLADAEKIMGESGHLIDTTIKNAGEIPKFIDEMSKIKKEAYTYNSGYMANALDLNSGKTGIIYFVYEQYRTVSDAKTVYSHYEKANVNAIGYKILSDIGDEAWFGSSPLFIYVRKANKIFVMKVNKMTSKTSVEQFNLIAHKIASNI